MSTLKFKELFKNYRMIELNKVYCGKMEDVLKDFPDNYCDSIVTDSPYGLKFMNKKWDYDVPSIYQWEQAIRVLKPGGFLLSFGGTRTYHRMVVNIEDAGFEIRDQIMWLYGSGFPKSLDISKAIDSKLGAERKVVGEKIRGDVQKAKDNGMGYLADPANRNNVKQFGYGIEQLTEAETDEAKQWEGWGTALKPANEPICVARKPISESTVAENVLKWGTGGINIDGCRIETDDNLNGGAYCKEGNSAHKSWGYEPKINKNEFSQPQGRFPANIILDEFMAEELDKQSGILTSGKMAQDIEGGDFNVFSKQYPRYVETIGDTGGASRFFYVAKPSQFERSKGLKGRQAKFMDESREEGSAGGTNPRNRGAETKRENFHPTVKPIELMRYLVKLVTKKGGICLDPFCGSGTTLIAAKLELMNYVGIDKDAEHIPLAEARVAAWNPEKYLPQTLF